MGYLDDSFLMGDTFEECKKSVIATVKLFTKFGRLHMWNLLKIKNNALKISKGDYESKCRLNDASHIKLKWWI